MSWIRLLRDRTRRPTSPGEAPRSAREHSGPTGAAPILITGAAGRIGAVLRDGLKAEYELRCLDTRRADGIDIVADMTRLARIQPAFEGVSAVVHLAGDPRESAPWEVIEHRNIPITINAFEAAQRAGVRRLVFASSNHVTGLYELDEPYASVVAGRYDGLDPAQLPRIGADAPIRPDGPYAIGKAFGEAAGRYYADRYDLSVICLRIGHVNPENRPKNPGHFATLLTHRDLVQLVRCCLAAPDSLRFGLFYGVSANTWRIWDIEPARTTLGYEPADDAERCR